MKCSKFNIVIHKENNQYLLFNSLTGHTFNINSQTAQAITNQKISDIDSKTQDMFKLCNVLVEDDYNENQIYSYYFNKTKFDTQSISATILLTWACNFRCTYCYEGAGDQLSNTMTQESVDAVIEFLIATSEAQRGKYINIFLFGGEPLLNIDIGFYILDKIQEYCTNNDKVLICGIITNGSLLTEEILSKLQNYNCKMIQITLDGPPQIHNTRRIYKTGKGTFEQVLQSIQLTEKYADKMRCIVRINVDKTNIQEVENLMKLLHDAGIEKATVDFGIVHSSTDACADYGKNCFSQEELGDILDDLWKKAGQQQFSKYPQPMRKWTYCGLFGEYNYTIAPNRDVYKCWEMVGDQEHKIGIIDLKGNLTQLSRAFYDWMTIDPVKNNDCVHCEYLPACGGGCIMTSFNETGSYHSKGCTKIKGVIEKQIINYVHTVQQFKKI